MGDDRAYCNKGVCEIDTVDGHCVNATSTGNHHHFFCTNRNYQKNGCVKHTMNNDTVCVCQNDFCNTVNGELDSYTLKDVPVGSKLWFMVLFRDYWVHIALWVSGVVSLSLVNSWTYWRFNDGEGFLNPLVALK
ncbi:unnamed protein product [Bursaphelenchus okinawaensis]|uniref:Uncharacterized protein n=1 Tax=Bursaphelenchus okinawaensis TaxID=465554 RepID=A0A811JW00_9BILA|nr:unnamed protein product [Bursaphelenchus okinawaensis]CAG9085493.1 unnamed protein product [Bursaphelenchus okinawaensis]